MRHILIIGSGLAACQTANQLLKKEPQLAITILTKGQRHQCNSMLAQGGIAVALSENDDWQSHFSDTLMAGVEHNRRDTTEILVKEGPAAVNELIQDELLFDRTADDSDFQYGLEGAHSFPRILHCLGDQTGKVMTTFLQAQLAEQPQITWIEEAMVTELLLEPTVTKRIDEHADFPAANATTRCIGLRYLEERSGQLGTLTADAVVLATGGLGGLFPLTTNDATITGDGMALALRAGLALKDMEFIQFHPTLLTKNNHCYGLISEAVRGAGARLIDETGRALMAGRHPLGDLAPRDIVARELTAAYDNGHQVFLDIQPVQDFEQHFPQITANLDRQQIPFRQTWRIPVRPGAHFMMGGIAVDTWGQTALAGLYAVGETACTGVHGANRLASNSLLECIVFGKRVAEQLLHIAPAPAAATERTASVVPPFILPPRRLLQQKCWQHLGIRRSSDSLQHLLSWLAQFHYRQLPATYTKKQLECANLCLVAETAAKAALLRQESLGAHAISQGKIPL